MSLVGFGPCVNGLGCMGVSDWAVGFEGVVGPAWVGLELVWAG